MGKKIFDVVIDVLMWIGVYAVFFIILCILFLW